MFFYKEFIDFQDGELYEWKIILFCGCCFNRGMFNMLREEIGLGNFGCWGIGFIGEVKLQFSIFLG